MKITISKVRKWDTRRKLEEIRSRIDSVISTVSNRDERDILDEALLIVDIWKRDAKETHEEPKKKERKSKRERNIFEAIV